MINTKIGKEDIIKNLSRLNAIHSKYNKVYDILIIGGASFILRDTFTRDYTTDIDAFILRKDSIGNIKRIFKNNLEFHQIFNSEAEDVVFDHLRLIDKFDEVLINKYSNIRIFIPPIEASIVMKITSFTHKNNRAKDMKDICNKKIYKIADKEKVLAFLNKWMDTVLKRYKLNNNYDYIETYNKWVNNWE